MEKYTCTECPNSCPLEVIERDGEIEVSGANCAKGRIFATEKYNDPLTEFSGIVKVEGATVSEVDVCSTDKVPKDIVGRIEEELSNIVLQAPVKYREVIINNVFDTGVDIISKRMIRKA